MQNLKLLYMHGQVVCTSMCCGVPDLIFYNKLSCRRILVLHIEAYMMSCHYTVRNYSTTPFLGSSTL
jgi:hypothetical protein